jgi:hypothetical protein
MSTPTPTPTPTDPGYDPYNFIKCDGYVYIILAIVLFPLYATLLFFALYGIVVCVRRAFRAIYAALCARALNVQLDSTEDDGEHGGETFIPLVFCGTWMRPPTPTQEAPSVDQSKWSSVQVCVELKLCHL